MIRLKNEMHLCDYELCKRYVPNYVIDFAYYVAKNHYKMIFFENTREYLAIEMPSMTTDELNKYILKKPHTKIINQWTHWDGKNIYLLRTKTTKKEREKRKKLIESIM